MSTFSRQSAYSISVALLISAAWLIGCDSGSATPDDVPPPATRTYSIKYEVTSTAASVKLIYLLDGTNFIEENSSVPWSKTFTARAGQTLSIGAIETDPTAIHSVTVKLYIDDQLERSLTDPITAQITYTILS